MASKLTPHEHSLLNRFAARPFRITDSRSARSRDQAVGEWYRRPYCDFVRDIYDCHIRVQVVFLLPWTCKGIDV
jgi:hypothetical protein